MREFPDKIHVDNKGNFPTIYYERYLCYLRRDIYEHVLQYDENTYFEIDTWCRLKLNNKIDIMETMIFALMKELNNKGWKCKRSFGGTGLFIYSTEKPPIYCYDDTL